MPLRRLLALCLAAVCAVGVAQAQSIVVQPGDSLWSLARAHDTTVAELMAANALTSERLSLGQVLQLPGGTSVEHVVRPNDTLYEIARRYDVSVQAIQAANAVSGTTIRPGQVLTIPGASAEPEPTAAAAPAPAEEAAAPAAAAAAAPEAADIDAADQEASAPEASAAEGTEPAADVATVAPVADANETPAPARAYVVQSADTLYDIARAHGVSVDDLIAWNGLDGTLIRPGQSLSLGPTPATPVAQPLVVTVTPGDNLWTLDRKSVV